MKNVTATNLPKALNHYSQTFKLNSETNPPQTKGTQVDPNVDKTGLLLPTAAEHLLYEEHLQVP